MTHEERVWHHLYETNEGIAEQSERIARLEELVLDYFSLCGVLSEIAGKVPAQSVSAKTQTWLRQEFDRVGKGMRDLEVRA